MSNYRHCPTPRPSRPLCRDSIRVPSAIVNKLSAEINRGLADPKIKQRFDEMGVLILRGPPEDFGKMIADETERWGKAIKFANISAD
jgi:tripartite-type tricarboxylate transporter receptor subunit TctC